MGFRKASVGLVRGFLKDERGVGTVFSLSLFTIFVMFGGMAADIQNVMDARTQLQMNADAVAHAAILSRETLSASDARVKALAISAKNNPAQDFGDVITADDIDFGNWDDEEDRFTVNQTSRTGVRVVARRDTSRENPIGTFMLWIVGFDEWDVSVTSTMETYHPLCLQEGFVAQGVVDIQSNNSYFKGFCIHANDHVEINSNNYFEAGTRVSMPDLDDLELPASGFEKNEGLEEALVEGSLNVRILGKISSILTGVKTSGSAYYQSYVTNSTIITLTKAKPEKTQFVSGRIHTYTCNGNSGSGLTIPAGTYSNIVIVTNCAINFSQNVVLENSFIGTTNTSVKSVQGASGLVLGKADNCAAGGEAQIVTMGGFFSSADIKTNGSQILANGNITFSANGDGLDGASFVAGGTISGTSNMDMSLCGTMENSNFQANYFRLVR